MLTQCPNCQAIFRVKVDQLKVADGQVQCGRCQTPFDALANLYSRQEQERRRREETPPPAPPKRKPPAQPHPPEPSETQAAQPKAESAEPSSPASSAPASTAAPRNRPKRKEQPAARPAKRPENNRPAPKPAPRPERSKTPSPPPRQPPPPPAAEKPEERAPDYTLPLEENEVISHFAPLLLMGVATLLLLLMLPAQYLYHMRDHYAHDPSLRPYLEWACRQSGCQLPAQRDLGAIQLRNHHVGSHPDHPGALLITARLFNHAPFPQPYPRVTLSMTNIKGDVVASRQFLPGEYLELTGVGNLMPSDREVSLLLELVDPGENAIGFEFDFD